MKRTALRRTTGLRRSGRLRRARPEGAAGRASLPPTAYIRLKWMILDRAGWKCERCRSQQAVPEIDHAVNRSAGSADSWHACSALCHWCHARKDWPYAEGRLVIEPQGDGRFRYVVLAGTKAAPREVDVQWGGRAPTAEEAERLSVIMREARVSKRSSPREEVPGAAISRDRRAVRSNPPSPARGDQLAKSEPPPASNGDRVLATTGSDPKSQSAQDGPLA